MKVVIDNQKDTKEQAISIINKIYDTSSKTNNPGDEKKVICHKCGVDLFEKYDPETVNKIKNYCKIQYKIKNTDKFNVFCKDCQKIVTRGDSE